MRGWFQIVVQEQLVVNLLLVVTALGSKTDNNTNKDERCITKLKAKNMKSMLFYHVTIVLVLHHLIQS
jgi:hypothetical protein